MEPKRQARWFSGFPQNTDETYHSADGAADSVGLELTIEATSHLVDLQTTEHSGSEQVNYMETWAELPKSFKVRY